LDSLPLVLFRSGCFTPCVAFPPSFGGGFEIVKKVGMGMKD